MSQTYGNIEEFNSDISLLKKAIIGAIPRSIPHIDVDRFPDYLSGWDIEDMVSAWTYKEKIGAFITRKQLPSIASFGIEVIVVDWKQIEEEQLPYFMKWNPIYYFIQESYDEVAKNIIEKVSNLYVLNATTLSFAIQAAIVMGAKKLFLVGCGAERIGLIHHSKLETEMYQKIRGSAEKHGYEYVKGQQWWNTMWDTMFAAYKKEVGFFAKAFDKFDLEIVRYFYKPYGSYSKGENKIV